VNSTSPSHLTLKPTPPAADAGADPTLRRLAAGLAHNVNNALTGVIGYLELALGEAPPDGELASHLRNSLSCAFRAAETVRRIVTYAVRPPPADALAVLSLREAARRVLAGFTPSVPAAVMVQITGDSPGWIQADAALLDSALDQLLANAVEAMPHGGALTLHLHEEGDLCCLSVRDTGPGVAPEVIAQLFEPFVTTKAAGHLGLGLALCRELVRAQRGGLQVASVAGQGATVTLSFPSIRNEGERGAGS
jgi:two-component system, cell cycle sensor histidine kinase and response regulator CckA